MKKKRIIKYVFYIYIYVVILTYVVYGRFSLFPFRLKQETEFYLLQRKKNKYNGFISLTPTYIMYNSPFNYNKRNKHIKDFFWKTILTDSLLYKIDDCWAFFYPATKHLNKDFKVGEKSPFFDYPATDGIMDFSWHRRYGFIIMRKYNKNNSVSISYVLYYNSFFSSKSIEKKEYYPNIDSLFIVKRKEYGIE